MLDWKIALPGGPGKDTRPTASSSPVVRRGAWPTRPQKTSPAPSGCGKPDGAKATAASRHPERLVGIVGAAIGLSILGDSFLYGVLPLEAEKLGIALPLVGVMLSANRLIRLLSNTAASALFERFGPRRPFILATVLALLTTTVYGLGWGVIAFLLARIGWGIAWSGLRQGGYQAVWTGSETIRGRLMGLLMGLIRLGSALSVLAGGYLRDRYGYQAGITAITVVTALAIPVACFIRWPSATPFRKEGDPLLGWENGRPVAATHAALPPLAFAIASPSHRWLLASGFLGSILEGVLISTVSLFLARQLGRTGLPLGLGMPVGTIAGFVLAVRWLADLVFGPAFGALSDRLGRSRTVLLLASVVLIGLSGAVSLPGLWPLPCLAVVLVANGGLYVTLSATANSAAVRSGRPHHFVGVYTTVTDAGSALGPLLAYAVGGVLGLNLLYVGTSSLLTAALWRYRQVETRA